MTSHRYDPMCHGCQIDRLQLDLQRESEAGDEAALRATAMTTRAIAAEAAVARVRALHSPRTEYLSASSDPNHIPMTQQVCRICGPLRYPCATVAALDAP